MNNYNCDKPQNVRVFKRIAANREILFLYYDINDIKQLF